MKTTLTLSILFLALGLSSPASAKDAATPDRAARLLDAHGSISIKSAGPYVELGTYEVQVVAKLGRPSAILADGTWLYQHYVVPNSAARGSLVVRFHQGQVSDLTLVTPAVVAAIQSRANDGKTLISKK